MVNMKVLTAQQGAGPKVEGDLNFLYKYRESR